MELPFLLRGLAIGFSIAAPVGPIGVLCIRRTLADGRLAGFVSGLGAASADAAYGAVAGFGLTVVSAALVSHQAALRLVGGAFLCYLGAVTLVARPPTPAVSGAARRGLAAAYLSVFALTITNPMTILSFAAIFAALGLADTGGDWRAAAELVLGVFAGSAAWWLILAVGAGALRTRLSPRGVRWINGGSGLIILAFGVVSLIGLLD